MYRLCENTSNSDAIRPTQNSKFSIQPTFDSSWILMTYANIISIVKPNIKLSTDFYLENILKEVERY